MDTEAAIKRLQDNLPLIRRIEGLSAEELGSMIGVSRQTVKNIECNRTKMSKAQYIAIRTAFDYLNEASGNKDREKVVNYLLDKKDLREEDVEKIRNAEAYLKGAEISRLPEKAIASTLGGLLAGVAFGAALAGGAWLEKFLKTK